MGSATIRLRKAAAALPLIVAFALLAVPAAYADANHSATGRGTSSQYFCGSGVPNVATIQFQAQKSKGIMQGGFSIFGSTVVKFGNINAGTINASSYSLTATVTADQCGGTFNNVVAQATISGQCGTAVTIHYVDTLGETGDFVGNVACA
jgi:hypothetical protein